MRVPALDGHVEPPLPLPAHDHADGLAVALQNGALLDVRLDEGAEPVRPASGLAAVADPGQLAGEGRAVLIGTLQREVPVQEAGVDARGQHRRGETGAFLVGPVDDFDRRARPDARIVQGPDDLESRQHAEHTVEPAALRLGVEVRAGGDRGGGRVGTGAAGEHVAQLVDVQGTARLPAPPGEQIPPPAVLVGEREPGNCRLRRWRRSPPSP